MIERVVYLLGAGFSAPLGLPVIADFLGKSKDMYFTEPNRYPHFQRIFKMIAKISTVKSYYQADLLNIEEILSILEMADQVEALNLRDDFVRYLRDVVEYHTPRLEPYDTGRRGIPESWPAFVFGDRPTSAYAAIGAFVANLLHLRIRQNKIPSVVLSDRFAIGRASAPQTRYSVVTLNYDRVLEQVGEYLQHHYTFLSDVRCTLPIAIADAGDPWAQPCVIKLHGDVGSGRIVPPTWSKSVHTEILQAWKDASTLLRTATQVRVIGYSLPIADAYIKYLLKAAVREAEHLKALDVLCWDPDGSVATRYREFVTFRDLRFKSRRTEEYLQSLVPSVGSVYEQFAYDKLEHAHRACFE